DCHTRIAVRDGVIERRKRDILCGVEDAVAEGVAEFGGFGSGADEARPVDFVFKAWLPFRGHELGWWSSITAICNAMRNADFVPIRVRISDDSKGFRQVSNNGRAD